jgi:hypothetical protein
MTTKSPAPKNEPSKDEPQYTDEPQPVDTPRTTVNGGSVIVNTEVPAESANEGTNVTFTNPETGQVETLSHNDYLKLRDEKGW